MSEPADVAQPQQPKKTGGVKELVENMLIAFVLAFMFRCFVVEAFVIPTGSMAPTLLGAHMRHTDPDSGYTWITNYSAVEGPGGQMIVPPRAVVVGQRKNGEPQVLPLISPNTLYRVPPVIEGDPDNDATAPPIHYGDRILVQKYIYLLRDPARWDVIVFKNPDRGDGRTEPYQQNFIKRLIGLPGETVMILDGDIYVADTPNPTPADYVIQTKPKKVQDALWRIVYDHDFKSQGLPRNVLLPNGQAIGLADPPFVTPWMDLSGTWDTDAGSDGRSIVFNGTDETVGRATLRFDADRNKILDAELAGDARPLGVRLLAPMFTDWLAADATLNSHPTADKQARRSASYPYTHTDGYRPTDTDVLATGGKVVRGRVSTQGDAMLSVRDVMLEFDAFTGGDGPIELTVTRRDVTFTATLTPEQTTLTMQRIGGDPVTLATSPVALPNGTWTHVEFASVDHQVTLRIDGDIAVQTTPEQFAPDVAALLAEYFANARAPKARLAITAEDVDVELRHVKVWRDVYHLNNTRNGKMIWGMPTEDGALKPVSGMEMQMPTPIVLGPDEFFTLGDNSLLSGDSRYWNNPVELEAEGLSIEPGRVPRRFILGKAFFVYWPAGHRPIERMPSLVPNFGEMRFIH